MGLTKFPNGVSSFGVPVLGGCGVPFSTGKYFFVSSLSGAAGNTGTEPAKAVATIAQALAKCTASAGDVVVVMPGHAETVSAASGLDINVAGVTVIGIGRGTLRPTITLDTAATAKIAISADCVTLKNVIVTANYADITVAIITSAKDICIDGVEFQETATNMNFLSCIATNAVANASDGLTIINCRRMSVDAAALAFISILAATNRLTVRDNIDTQSSAADVGHFIIMGTFVCLGAVIIGNILNLNGDNNGQTVGVFMTGSSTTSTGIVAFNLVNSLDATTELFDTATLDFGHFENRMTGAIAKSGYVLPAIDS